MGKNYKRDELVRLYEVCGYVRKNGDNRWSEGFHGSGYEYKE